MTSPEDHPFLFLNLTKKIKFDVFKVNGFKWTDLERTQDWPESFISTSALRSRTSYFLKYLNKKSSVFNQKTCNLNHQHFIRYKE